MAKLGLLELRLVLYLATHDGGGLDIACGFLLFLHCPPLGLLT